MVQSIAGVSDSGSSIKMRSVTNCWLESEHAVRRIGPHISVRMIKRLMCRKKMTLAAEFRELKVWLRNPRSQR